MVLTPFQVDFDVTLKCMYKCRHCNVSAGEKLKDEMTLEQIKGVLDQLDEMGVSDVSITGGEPLLRNDCLEILRYASGKKGFYVTLNSNGLLINDDTIRFLEENCPNINVAVSLDGYNPETYSILRRSFSEPSKILEKEFNQVLDTLSRLAASKLKASVNYTITQATINNFWQTYDLVKNIGIKCILAIKFFPYGEGRKNKTKLELTYKEWNDFLNDATIKKIKDNYYKGVQISVTCPWEMYLPLLSRGYTKEQVNEIWNYNSPLQSELYRRSRNLGCHAGITSCAISPNGDVYPCGTISSKFPPFVCGNLKESMFIDIWEKSPVLLALRSLDVNMLEGKCTSCKYVELCGGGCRARAFTEYNSLVAPDYLCPIHCIQCSDNGGGVECENAVN